MEDGAGNLGDRAREADGAGAAQASRGRRLETRVGVIMLGSRARHLRALADHVELAEHVVQLEAVAKDPRARAQRRGEGGHGAVAVDH